MLIRHANLADLDTITEIELSNFGSDVAISREAFEERLTLMTDTFLVIEEEGKVLAYIEGPVVERPLIHDGLFHKVEANPDGGGYIAITSLSVSPAYKGQGLGTTLLAAMKDLAVSQKRFGLVLTCEDYLVPYYEMNGFLNEGQAESCHGGRVWYAMSWKIP